LPAICSVLTPETARHIAWENLVAEDLHQWSRAMPVPLSSMRLYSTTPVKLPTPVWL